MSLIQGTISHGHIIPDAPLDWPDGTRVTILPPEEPTTSLAVEQIGLREEDWPTTPDGIAKLVQRIKSFEPVEITPEEESLVERFRAEMKQKSIEAMKRSWEAAE